ncbi:thioredoxin family protein [Candidatus Poribacteria bacterium]|nr:thioredoxin family protein [Candidatus Poribacteria bacterium]
MNSFKLTQIGVVILLVLQISIFSGCDQYKELTNDPPKINSFTVPTEVEYGETITLKVRVFDPEDDALTYTWDVSDGTLLGGTGPEVQWTAPKLPPEEMVPPKVVTVNVYVRDGGEEDVSKTASITVFSKAHRVAQSLSGTYTLVAKRVHGDPVAVAGLLRLTTTTFILETQDILEDGAKGPTQFVSGSYKLVTPFDERSGTIHWSMHGDPTPSIGAYTWDGKFFVIAFRGTATQYVYNRSGAESGGVEEEDVDPEPIEEEVEPEPVDTDPEPIEEEVEPEPIDTDPEPVEEEVEPEPIDVDPEPVEAEVEPEPVDTDPEPVEEEVEPEPINTDGKPVVITDATFKTKVLEAKLPVVLEFEADWCPFCRQMKPVVASVVLEHRDTFIIGKLDIDENRQTTEKYKVKGIPTYVVFRDGVEVSRFAGAMPKAVFEQRILTALK